MRRYGLALVIVATLGCEEGGGSATTPSSSAHGAGPRYAVIIDRSVGMQNDEGKACQNLEWILEKLVDATHNKQARASVFLTGTKKHMGATLLDQFSFDGLHAQGGIEASAGGKEEAAKRRKAVVDGMVAKCKEQAKSVNYSPLYAALADVVKDLSQVCKPSHKCRVTYYTDLQEIAEPWLCTEIFGADAYGKRNECPANKGRPAPKKSKENGELVLEWQDEAKPIPVDATGLAITVCGLTESTDATAKKMSPASVERRDAAWKSLFPGAQSFEILSNCSML